MSLPTSSSSSLLSKKSPATRNDNTATSIQLRKCSVYKELKTKANDFLNSRLESNKLVEIITYLENSLAKKDVIATPALLVLEVVFEQLLKRGSMLANGNEDDPDDCILMEYANWLRIRFEEAMNLILKIIHEDKPKESEQALSVYMKLLIAESENPIDPDEKNLFPIVRLCYLLKKLLSHEKDQINNIQNFQQFTDYVDIVYYSWRELHSFSSKNSFENVIFARNYIEMIYVLHINDNLLKNNKMLCKSATKEPGKCNDYAELRKILSKTWNFVIEWSDKADESIQRKILITLLERIMKHLLNPIMLTDYLIDSLNCGGPISLLAFQGIYWLIQKHNIIYPNIYQKLYSMFEPEIFSMKYKNRLFYLADIFLSSTHLPERLVAAFVKRLLRLSLIASPQDTIVILKFISNLILRFAGLKSLISTETESRVLMKTDTYVMEERDPMLSCAIDGQLWEIIMLQKHAWPNVAKLATQISRSLPKEEFDLALDLSLSENDIFGSEISEKDSRIIYALAIIPPDTKFEIDSDQIYLDIY